MESTINVSKKLSEVIDKIGNVFVDLGTQIDLAFEIGRDEGFTDIEIGDMIRKRLIGLKSLPTIRKMLPSSAIHHEKVRHDYVKDSFTSPEIPPPNQEIKDAEVVTTEPKPITDRVIIYRKKLPLESKLALSSRSDLELTINGNEVVRIKEI